jgi:hypothetical protein
LENAKYDFGFVEPFGLTLPYSVAVDPDTETSLLSLKATATEYVLSEIRRFQMVNSVIQINPIFGKPSFVINDKSVFVLMPFDDEMT